MENYFYTQLNENTVEAVRRDTAFFMSPPDSRIPPIMDSYRGQPITGANYFNLQLSNDISGKGHTEYVRMNEALSANRDWLSTLPRESRPRGTLYQEERADSNAGYSFVMPTAELNQSVYRDNRATVDNRMPVNHYVPYQSSSATMGNFNEFVHEQFANAVNASLANCPFRNNIHPHEMAQFKERLAGEISRNPAFMTVMANRARDEAVNYHYIPLDRNKFIERARDETSPEFTRLNYAINAHVHDMHHNRKESFNHEFNTLARPLLAKVADLYLQHQHPRPAVDHEIADFVKKMIREEKRARVLADTYAGTFVEKAVKLARTAGKGIFAGVMIAGALIGTQYALPAAGIAGAVIGSIGPIMNFCSNVAQKMDGVEKIHSRLDDVVKVAAHIMKSQEMKGDKTLRTRCDHHNHHSFYTHLNHTVRRHPHTLDHAVAHINNRQHDQTQSATRGQSMRR